MIQRTLLFILMMLCPPVLVWADDWPQWRGPERIGISKEKGLLSSWPPGGPKWLWTFREAGMGCSSMSVVGDRLYTMGAEGNKEYVFAIDLKKQKKIWSVEVGACRVYGNIDSPCGTPTVDGSFLYAIGGHGDLVCVETGSGKKVWSQAMETSLGSKAHYGYTESPLIDGDQVVATPGGKKGAIAAFDKKTGALKWRSTMWTDEAFFSSMIAIEVSGNRQYVQMTEANTLLGVRASDGKLLWTLPFRGICTPICQNDCVYVSSLDDCQLLKLIPNGDKCKADLIYTNKQMQNHYGGVILVDGYLYGYSDRGHCWLCQDFKTGKRVWKGRPGRALGSGSVIFADGNLYCYHENRGDVLLIQATPSGCKEQGRLRIPEETKLPRNRIHIYPHPVVANGKLYLRDQNLIFCYDIRKLP